MKKLILTSFVLAYSCVIASCSQLNQATNTINNANRTISEVSKNSALKKVASQDLSRGISNTSRVTSGVYYIVNVGNQKALTLPKKEKFRIMTFEEIDGNDLQKWEVIANKDGSVRFKLYDSPNWYMYFVNKVSLATDSKDAENFKLVPAKGTSNKFHLIPSKYGGKALIWNGTDVSYGTDVEMIENNKYDQFVLIPAR